jgi:hypothetical protein
MKRTLFQQLVVVRMATYPEPEHAIGDLGSESSVTKSNPNRENLFNTLEMQRWMTRIFFETGETLIR